MASIRAGSGRRGSGDRLKALRGGLSQNVEQKKEDGWMDEEVEKNEKGIRREGRGFKPGKVVPLEMGLPLGLAILSKSLQL